MAEAKKLWLGPSLHGLANCPRCGVASPMLPRIWESDGLLPRDAPGPRHKWVLFWCTSCGGCVLACGFPENAASGGELFELVPAARQAHEDIPEPARTFLDQAYRTLHAPDAAAVMAGSAVDAMLKELKYIEGSIYTRIKQAVAEHKLTEGMGQWAHEVRLGSNRPRHADKEKPHVSPEEAGQSVEFAEALGFFLFVLTKRVERGTKAAQEASKD